MKWAYGVTTVPSRVSTYLPRTLESLRRAGFGGAHIFMDGQGGSVEDTLQLTTRNPAVGVFGNWALSMWELYIRYPRAELFAIFQDDLVMCKNTRGYIEKHPPQQNQYLNLYTVPQNEVEGIRPSRPFTGYWYESNQMGKGALALVFPQRLLHALFVTKIFMDWPKDDIYGKINNDGCISKAVKSVHGKELVHSPSLTQHIGDVSSFKNMKQEPCTSFPGEDVDAMEFPK